MRAAVVVLIAIACGKHSAPVAIAAGDVPSPAELNAYVSNAGNVHLTMKEDEVDSALGAKPTRRMDAASQDGETQVAWDQIGGDHPGAAAGRFYAQRLTQIEFAPASRSMPRISKDVADSLLRQQYAQRAVAHTLRMTDIESVTASKGARALWRFTHRPPDGAIVTSVWMWEVEPGGEALIVEEQDGSAGQPVVRSLK